MILVLQDQRITGFIRFRRETKVSESSYEKLDRPKFVEIYSKARLSIFFTYLLQVVKKRSHIIYEILIIL